MDLHSHVMSERAPAKWSRLPRLGRHGEGWLAGQLVLVAAVLLSAFGGLDWPTDLRTPAHAIGGVLLGLGALILAVGIVQLAARSSLTPLPSPRARGELVTSGLYAWTRHPMYGGSILIALGWSVFYATIVGLLLTVVLILFFALKSRREEAWLLTHYAGYADYRRHTPHRVPTPRVLAFSINVERK